MGKYIWKGAKVLVCWAKGKAGKGGISDVISPVLRQFETGEYLN